MFATYLACVCLGIIALAVALVLGFLAGEMKG